MRRVTQFWRQHVSLFLGLLLATDCAEQAERVVATPEAQTIAAKVSNAVLPNETINPSGFATILDAPPAPFIPDTPKDPEPFTPAQIADQQQFTRVGNFQVRVRDKAQALDRQLRKAQKGNYVSVYYDNDGDPSVVFQFLRDGPGTLRRYTSHPSFIGKTVPYSMAQLHAASAFMWTTFGKDRVIQSTGIGRNEVDVSVLVPEAEFRALVARKKVKLPAPVRLEFSAAPIVIQPGRPALGAAADSLNASLPPDIAQKVRIFARDNRPDGMLNDIVSRAKVVLRDGCFRIADQGDALVLFPLGARLFIDSEGYLAFGDKGRPGYARVGETIVFAGSLRELTIPALVDPIHAACGPGKVMKVTSMESEAARSAQQRVIDEYNAVRMLGESYGLSKEQARRALVFLDKQQATRPRQIMPDGTSVQLPSASIIMISPPHPPVANQSECPSGTKLRFGMCRTPEGYLRPLPQWLAEFLEQDTGK
jgi:hypothetical protein